MTDKKVKFNPSLGGAFSHDAFGRNGKEAIKLDITAENYQTLMDNLQIGSSILLRFNKVTTKGNKHFFAEMLPPMTPRPGNGAPKARTAPVSDID